MEQKGTLTGGMMAINEVQQNRLIKGLGTMGKIVDYSEDRIEHPVWLMKTRSKNSEESTPRQSVKKRKMSLEPKRNRSQEMPRLKSSIKSEGHHLSLVCASSIHSTSLSKEASAHPIPGVLPKKAKSYNISDSRPRTTHKKDPTASLGKVSSRSSSDTISVTKDQTSKGNFALRSRSQNLPHSEPVTGKSEKNQTLSRKITAKESVTAEKKDRSRDGLRKMNSDTGKVKTDYRSKFFPDLEFIPRGGIMTLPSLLSKTDEPVCFKTHESQPAKDDNRLDGKTSGRKIQDENRLFTHSEKLGKRQINNPTETTSDHIARSRIKSAQAVKSNDDSIYWRFVSPETKVAYNDHILNERKPNNSLYLQILEEDNRMSAILQGDNRNTSEISTKKSKPFRKSARTSQTLSTEESQQPPVSICSTLPRRSFSSSPNKVPLKVSNISALKKQYGSCIDPKSSSKALNHLNQETLEIPQKEIEECKNTRTRKNDETSVPQKKSAAVKNSVEPRHKLKTEASGNCSSLRDSKKSYSQEDNSHLVKYDTSQNRKTKSNDRVSPRRRRSRIVRVPRKDRTSSTGVQSAVSLNKSLEEDGKSRPKFFRKSNAVTEIAMNSESSLLQQQRDISSKKKSFTSKQKEGSEQSDKADNTTSILKKSSKLFNVSDSNREPPVDTFVEVRGKKKKNRCSSMSNATKILSSRGNSAAGRENMSEGISKKNMGQELHHRKRQLRTTSETRHRNHDINRSYTKDSSKRGDIIPILFDLKVKSMSIAKSTPICARLSDDSSRLSAFSDSNLSGKRSPDEATPRRKRRIKRFLTASEYKSAGDVSDNNDGAGQKSSTEEGENNAVDPYPNNRNKSRKKRKRSLKQKSDWNNSLQEDPEADDVPENVKQFDDITKPVDDETYVSAVEDLEELEGEAEEISSSSGAVGVDDKEQSRKTPRKRVRIKTKPRKKIQQQSTASSKPRFSGWDIGTKLEPAAMDHIPTELELVEQLVQRSVKLGWDQDRKSRFEKEENKFASSVVTSFGPDEPKTYLAKHEIHSLFQYMTAKLVKDQPVDPLDAMIEYAHDLARHKRAVKTTNLSSRTCLEQSQETAKVGETARDEKELPVASEKSEEFEPEL